MKPILQPGRNCGGLQEVHDTGLLIDCRDYYRAFYHAAKAAQRFILIAGWQFDSTVRLLRGEDVKEARAKSGSYRFSMGSASKTLNCGFIFLLGTSTLFSRWSASGDKSRCLTRPRTNGCNFALTAAIPWAPAITKICRYRQPASFIGGADLGANRWDDRRHRAEHSERREADAKPYGPYHEVHSYHIGPVARQLTELFILRWRQSGCDSITLPPPPLRQVVLESSADIVAAEAALSRTQPPLLGPPRPVIQEICQLYLTAVAAAEETIYIETQYFSSHAICRALAKRMRDTGALNDWTLL